MRVKSVSGEDPDVNVASLIDMVFLLLVYFMATASLVQSEADLGIKLPGMMESAKTVDMVDEQTIEVRKGGQVVLNGREYDDFSSVELPQLTEVLTRYRMASDASGNEPMVTIWAEDEVIHQRVIDVMNACAKANLKNVTFTASSE